jgi:hypothetical protein
VSSIRELFRVLALCGTAGLLLTASRGSDPTNGLSLKILDASAPPGGTIQLSLTVTEPKPIITARAAVSFAPALLGPAVGLALYSSGAPGDVAGAAVVRGNQLSVRATSPSGGLGMATVPLLMATIGVRPDAPVGAQGILALDPSSSLWIDPNGQPYPQQVKPGTFTVGGTVSISDVFPGTGMLPAGSTVVVRGIGFQPGAQIDIDSVHVASTVIVNSTEADLTIADAADLYGRRVRVRNPDQSQAMYYAYLRAASLGQSTRSLLAATMPIFTPQTLSGAYFTNAAAPGQFLALALQNPGAAPADVTVELRSNSQGLIASTVVTLPPRTKMAREVSELFSGATAPADGFLAVRSSAPVQMLGLVGDDAAGTVDPLLPALPFP